MAHAQKYVRSDINKLVSHDERSKSDNVKSRKNETIDPTRTHLNYTFESIHDRDLDLYLENYDEKAYLADLDEMFADMFEDENEPQKAQISHKYDYITPLGYVKEFGSLPDVAMSNRKDLKAMVSWVVTKPENVTEDEQERFFEETYAFLRKRYCDKVEKAVGMSPVITAVVHLDETTPHMHFKFIPTYYDKKTEKWRVSAKEVLNRRDLQTFHKDLSAHMSRVFGRDIGIENGATRDGNKSVMDLKKQTAQEVYDLDMQLFDLGLEKFGLQGDIERLQDELKSLTEKVHVEEERLSETLSVRLRAYQKVIARLPKNIRDQIERDVDKELHPSRYRSRSHDFDER